MKYLFVGKNGTFDTMIIAMGFAGLADIGSCHDFANCQIENNHQIIKVGNDTKNDEVYVAGYKYPNIAEILKNELERLGNVNNDSRLILIKTSTKGENLNSYLIMFSKIPLLGPWFAKLAKFLTLQHKDKLLKQGSTLHLQYQTLLGNEEPRIIAAKPF